jgi:glycosyltransferase involved in cell wall biosynthesis
MESIKYSVILPVYKNQDSIQRLLIALSDMNKQLGGRMEAVFVVDGSPDESFAILKDTLNNQTFPSQLLLHSRNFGSFPAIRTGLAVAKGAFFGVMAADLQEPPSLLLEIFQSLSKDECDVGVGTRSSRQDPFFSKIASQIFWKIYKRLIVKEMPEGGVDVFACNLVFKNQLLQLEESRSSLIALIFWLGFRRKLFFYDRLERQEGISSWTLNKKIDYMMDSIFAFTDYPIKLLIRIGFLGCVISFIVGLSILIAKAFGFIDVPGYAATMLVVLFFGALHLFSLGLVGNYAWRAYENTKKRPLAIVSIHTHFLK